MTCSHDKGSDVYSDCARPALGSTAHNVPPTRVRLHRRVNVFVYLNHAWSDVYGGHLELWSRNLSQCEQRILPTMGRFVAFSSTDFSFHGHPAPLRLPSGRMRRSV